MNKRILLSVLTLSFIYVLASCGDHSHEGSDHNHSNEAEATHDHEHEHDDAEHVHEHDHDDAEHDHDHDADQTGKEYTSAYICPMHCEGSGSDQAGTCPVCEMDYVENPDAKLEDDGDASEPV